MIDQLHAPAVLLSETVTLYPLKRTQEGPYSHLGPFGGGKTSCFSPGVLSLTACCPASIRAALSQLLVLR
jgi:hypothetical protein